MGRLLRAIILILLPLTILAVWGGWMFRFELAYLRFREAIDPASIRYGVPPSLMASLIWQESRFHPCRRGKAGEIGLVQILPSTAREWAAAEKVQGFCSADLFYPSTNVLAGAWYLGRALQRWRSRNDPLPCALAEYNAGASNAQRWDRDAAARSIPFVQAITYPATRRYVTEIAERHRNFGRPWRRWLPAYRQAPRAVSAPVRRYTAPLPVPPCSPNPPQ